jgi:sec-independent protein translocase protein TatC
MAASQRPPGGQAPKLQPKHSHDELRMPFLEHLRELRTRLMYCVISVVVCFLGCYAFHEEIFHWLLEPYEIAIRELPTGFQNAVLAAVPNSGVALTPVNVGEIYYGGLTGPFFVYLKTALLAGLVLSVPVIFWQLWLFIAPGLYQHEKRLAAPFVIGTTAFFVMGAAFCRYVVLGPAVKVLLAVGAWNTEPLIMMDDYFGLTSRFILVFGAVFEMPIVIMFLAMFGIVTHRGLIKQWRIAIVAAFVVGALLTPPDPFTQTALAIPMVVLYALSTGIAYVFTTRREQRRAAAVEEVLS